MSRNELLKSVNEIQDRLKPKTINLDRLNKNAMIKYVQNQDLIGIFRKVFSPRRRKSALRSLVQANNQGKRDTPITIGQLKRFNANQLKSWIKKIWKFLNLPANFDKWKTDRLAKYVKNKRINEVLGFKSIVSDKIEQKEPDKSIKPPKKKSNSSWEIRCQLFWNDKDPWHGINETKTRTRPIPHSNARRE